MPRLEDTKHESIYGYAAAAAEYSRGTIQEVIDSIDENTKGEFVVIVEGNKQEKQIDESSILDEINNLIAKGEKSKTAIEIVSSNNNLKKNYVYDLYIKNKK